MDLKKLMTYSSDERAVFIRETWETNLTHVKQQSTSVLESTVTKKNQEEKTRYYPVIDELEMSHVNLGPGKKHPTTLEELYTKDDDVKFDERKSTMAYFRWKRGENDLDNIWTGIQTQGAYTTAVTKAFNRTMDSVIIWGALKPIEFKSGFDSREGKSTIRNLNSLLFTKKPSPYDLLKIKTQLSKKVNEEYYFVHDSLLVEHLLKCKEVSSGDFNTIKALQAGELNNYCGLNFKMLSYNLIPTFKYDPNTGKIKSNYDVAENEIAKYSGTLKIYPVYSKDALYLSTGKKLEVKVGQSVSQDFRTYIHVSSLMNSFRMHDDGVGAIIHYDTDLKSTAKFDLSNLIYKPNNSQAYKLTEEENLTTDNLTNYCEAEVGKFKD